MSFAHSAEVVTLKRRIEEVEARAQRLDRIRTTSAQKIVAQREQIGELERHIRELEWKVVQMQNNLDAGGEMIEEREERIAAYRKRLGDKEARIGALKESIEELERILEQEVCPYEFDHMKRVYDAIPWEEIERMSAGWYTSDSATDLGTDHNSHCSSRQLTSARCDCERGMIRRILALREQDDG